MKPVKAWKPAGDMNSRWGERSETSGKGDNTYAPARARINTHIVAALRDAFFISISSYGQSKADRRVRP
ncbi:MAG: hypothetical protein IJC40_06275 [Muribaculaceae bacterium]|nr:hypothetical protein [Muribaculaceae bacterium]